MKRLLFALLLLPCLAWPETKTLQNGYNIVDTWLDSLHATTNYGTVDTLRATGSTSSFRSCMLFAFPHLTDSAYFVADSSNGWVLDSVQFHIIWKSKTPTSLAAYFFRADKPLYPNNATFNGWYGADSTWGSTGCKNAGATENRLNGSGNDFDSTSGGLGSTVTTAGDRSLNITTLYRQWMAGTYDPLRGIVVKAISASGAPSGVAYSSDNATTANKPYLKFFYHARTDLTHTLIGNLNDTWLDSAAATTNHGSDSLLDMSVISDGGGSGHQKTKALFSLDHIKDTLGTGKTFDSAKMHVYVTYMNGSGSMYLALMRSLKPMYEANATANGWYGADSAWGTFLAAATSSSAAENRTNGGSSKDRRISAFATSPALALGWNVIDLTDGAGSNYLQYWYDSTWTETFGFQGLASFDGTNSQEFKIASTEYPWQAYRPWIEYWVHAAPAVTDHPGYRYFAGWFNNRYKSYRQGH